MSDHPKMPNWRFDSHLNTCKKLQREQFLTTVNPKVIFLCTHSPPTPHICQRLVISYLKEGWRLVGEGVVRQLLKITNEVSI